jgi:anti-sigma B factor antagonist
MHSLQIQRHRTTDAEIVHLAGAIESSNFAGLLAVLNELLGNPSPRVVLDCSGVNYIATAELKELLDLAHIARARGGNIKCARLAPTIEQVATLIANGDPLECFSDARDAVASFRAA